MTKSEHCPDHCNVFADIAVIKSDVRHIKNKFDEMKSVKTETKTDVKWLMTFLVAVISFLYTYYK